MSTKRNTRSASAADPVKPDQMRSVADWMKLPAETLKLVCNNNGVQIKGGKKQMAQKLFNKFHPDNVANRRAQVKAKSGQTPAAKNNSDDLDAVLNDPPPEIIRAEDEPSDGESTLPYAGDAGINPGKAKQANAKAPAPKKARRDTPPPESEEEEEDRRTVQLNFNEAINRAVASAPYVHRH